MDIPDDMLKRYQKLTGMKHPYSRMRTVLWNYLLDHEKDANEGDDEEDLFSAPPPEKVEATSLSDVREDLEAEWAEYELDDAYDPLDKIARGAKAWIINECRGQRKALKWCAMKKRGGIDSVRKYLIGEYRAYLAETNAAQR